MASEWRDTTLGDVLTLQRGFDLPETERKPGPYPVIASTGPVGTHQMAMVKGPGVVIGRSGSLGGGQFVEGDFWPLNTTLWVKDFKGNDPRFCYYLLKSLDLAHFNAGSGVPTLNRNHIHPLPVKVPGDLAEQRAIAHILGTLDDKIELNRRMSETLEAMARALFKAWFVDFEPVRAKMEGRWRRGESLPGLPAYLYDLFPDRLVDSELGEIPEGWGVGTLGDLAEVTSGKRPDQTFASPTPDANVPLWGGNGPMAYVRQPLFTEPILLTGRVGTLGSVFRISLPCWPSDNTLVVLPRKRLYMEYLYFRMKGFDFDSLNRGSTQPLLTQTDLKKQPLLIASRDMLSEFHMIASDLFARVDAITRESRTLAALRDALLPKLIRGELRVKDAERFLKERGL
jgi:type I restriction enzyme S subunit